MAIIVDFYLAPEQSYRACGLFMCRLAEKIYNQGHWLYIHTTSIQETTYYDNLLWTYSDISFLPHTIDTEPAPIQIGHTPINHSYKDILLNLTPDIPDFHNQFNRIAEIIPNDQTVKAACRIKYKYYQDHGCDVRLHDLITNH